MLSESRMKNGWEDPHINFQIHKVLSLRFIWEPHGFYATHPQHTTLSNRLCRSLGSHFVWMVSWIWIQPFHLCPWYYPINFKSLMWYNSPSCFPSNHQWPPKNKAKKTALLRRVGSKPQLIFVKKGHHVFWPSNGCPLRQQILNCFAAGCWNFSHDKSTIEYYDAIMKKLHGHVESFSTQLKGKLHSSAHKVPEEASAKWSNLMTGWWVVNCECFH